MNPDSSIMHYNSMSRCFEFFNQDGNIVEDLLLEEQDIMMLSAYKENNNYDRPRSCYYATDYSY